MNDEELRIRVAADRYSNDEAVRIVNSLTLGELDGWKYREELVEDNLYIVVVYDEENKFVACWNS